MRFASHLVASALAGSAVASPLLKRAVVTDTELDVVWTTVYVTETDDAVTSTATTVLVTESPSAAVTTTASATTQNGFGFGFGHSHYSHDPVSASSTASTSVVTTPTTTTTSSASPEPVTATTPTATTAKPSITTTTTAKPTTTTTSTTTSSTLAPVTSPSTTKTTTRTTSSSTTTATPASTPASSYESLVLLHHNIHRSNHSASALVWNATLADIAASQAAVCNFAHNITGDYGQNIAAGVVAADIGTVVTELFYNGEINWYNGLYGQENPDMTNFEHWGHFSQLVWKATGSVACATADCSAKGLSGVGGGVAPYFTVCNYHMYGNVAGAYGDNVGLPLGNPSIYGTYTG